MKRRGFLAAVAAGGVTTVSRAWHSLRGRTLDIHVLMVVAVAGALALGEYFEAATVVFLFAAAQWLETYSIARARTAIASLMALAPREAVVVREGIEVRLPVAKVRVGDLVVVRPGEVIALDGEIVRGRTEVDQSAVTGESVPVPRDAGESVFAGTVNGTGAIEVRVSRAGADSTIARIIHLVEQAQASRARSQAFVGRFAAV
mgnify:FL=1